MSDSERMDWLLAEQCAPVLLGLKQANLVTLTKSRFRDARQAIASCSDKLMDYEISVSIMKESMRCYTVLIYRRESLAQMLENRDIRLFLEKNGFMRPRGHSNNVWTNFVNDLGVWIMMCVLFHMR